MVQDAFDLVINDFISERSGGYNKKVVTQQEEMDWFAGDGFSSENPQSQTQTDNDLNNDNDKNGMSDVRITETKSSQDCITFSYADYNSFLDLLRFISLFNYRDFIVENGVFRSLNDRKDVLVECNMNHFLNGHSFYLSHLLSKIDLLKALIPDKFYNTYNNDALAEYIKNNKIKLFFRKDSYIFSDDNSDIEFPIPVIELLSNKFISSDKMQNGIYKYENDENLIYYTNFKNSNISRKRIKKFCDESKCYVMHIALDHDSISCNLIGTDWKTTMFRDKTKKNISGLFQVSAKPFMLLLDNKDPDLFIFKRNDGVLLKFVYNQYFVKTIIYAFSLQNQD